MELVHHAFDDAVVVFRTAIQYLGYIRKGDDESVFWSQLSAFASRIMRRQGADVVSRRQVEATSPRHGCAARHEGGSVSHSFHRSWACIEPDRTVGHFKCPDHACLLGLVIG